MSERPSERGSERSTEVDKRQEIPSLTKSPEPQEDLHTKEVFSSVVGEIRPAMQSDVEDMRKLVTELREREYSRSNFVSPENMLGQSTWIRGDGKTFSGERLETIESMLEIMEMRLQGMARMEGLIKSGATLEAVKKDPFASRFLASPEGQLMQGVVFSNKDPKILEAEYSLAKARELKSNIIRGDELAQGWYEKLDGTPFEKVGKEEGMSLGDKSLRKGREFANSMLGLDSLFAMVTGAGIGRLAGTLISNSDKFRNAALVSTTALNESNIARAVMPGVSAMRNKAGETVAARLSKGAANFLAEVGKGFAYTEVARAVGGEDLAHMVSYPLMFIPGLRSEFEGSLKLSLSQNKENFNVFARWLVLKYKDPRKLEEAIATGLNEAHNRSKWNIGVDEAKQLTASMQGGLVKLFERFAPEKPAGDPVSKKSPGTRAGIAEKTGATIAEGQKSAVPDSIDTQSNSPKVQESVKSRVSEVLADDEMLREMMEMGLPKDYTLALRELGIPDNQIIKNKGWNEASVHRKEYIENYLVEFNQLAEVNGTPKLTKEEAHTLFGYTTTLFYRQLNGKLWKEEGQDLQITKLLKSALSKMPDAASVQHRGDEKLLDELLKKYGIFEQFFQGKDIPQETFDSLLGETIVLKGFTSAGNSATEPFWSKLDKTKYQITMLNSDAKDITKFAFFPNFGDEMKNGGKTQQESLFSSDKSIRIVSIMAAKKADGTPILKVIAECNNGELAK